MSIIICNHYKECKQDDCEFKYGVDTHCLDWHDDVESLDWYPNSFGRYWFYTDEKDREPWECQQRFGYYLTSEELPDNE
jgi:hypothetical protein